MVKDATGVACMAVRAGAIRAFSRRLFDVSTASTVPSTTAGLDLEAVQDAIAASEKLAGGYDYEGAIACLQAVERWEESDEIAAKIKEYEESDDQLVSYTDLDNITHIFLNESQIF